MHVAALVALADGTVFKGRSVGSAGESLGEMVFNTSMTGYQEILTDPSYAGQIVSMTYPHIGNYGVTAEDDESDRPHVVGFLMKQCCPRPSNQRATHSLIEFLQEHGIIGIEHIDTRELADRVVGASMSKLEVKDLGTKREAEDFVTQTDTEDGYTRPGELAGGVDSVTDRSRIARTI